MEYAFGFKSEDDIQICETCGHPVVKVPASNGPDDVDYIAWCTTCGCEV